MQYQPRLIQHLLDKITKLQQQNQDIKKQLISKNITNHKLYLENRHRRLKGNEFARIQYQKSVQIQNIKGSQEQLKNMIISIRKSMKTTEEQMCDYEDQIIILKVEVHKLKQINNQLEGNYNDVNKKLASKEKEIVDLNKIHQQIIAKTKLINQYPAEFDVQLLYLISENQQLESKLKILEGTIKELCENDQKKELHEKELTEELVCLKEILKIIQVQHEQQFKQLSEMTTPKQSCKTFEPKESYKKEVLKQSCKTEKPSTDQTPTSKYRPALLNYGQKLKLNVLQNCSNFENLIISQNSISNFTKKPTILHYCQPINLTPNGSWHTEIKISTEGQINFGISDIAWKTNEIKNNRNNFYYNNCSGIIVINKQGKIINHYAVENDVITINLISKDKQREIQFLKNDALIYASQLPHPLNQAEQLFPFIKLFEFSSVEL